MRIDTIRGGDREIVDRMGMRTGTAAMRAKVDRIIRGVAKGGDAYLRVLAAELGDPPPERLDVPGDEVARLAELVPAGVRRAMEASAEAVGRFARAVARTAVPVELRMDGWVASARWRPVASAGCYAPGGRHPLASSILMTVIPARAAGVGSVHAYSPSTDPGIALACILSGAESLSILGGAQAIAAMAVGTETFPAVDMACGPGGVWVTEAKRRLQGAVGTDILAGPSELAVLASPDADPRLVALDLLAQAEHDALASAWLLTWGEGLAAGVRSEITSLAEEGPGVPGRIVLCVLDDPGACVRACNRLAPEHVELMTGDDGSFGDLLESYGAVFVSAGSCTAFGDYSAGPSHTLPTSGTARFCGGLSPFTFLRLQSCVEAGPGAEALAEGAAALAGLEGMYWHGRSAEARVRPVPGGCIGRRDGKG